MCPATPNTNVHFRKKIVASNKQPIKPIANKDGYILPHISSPMKLDDCAKVLRDINYSRLTTSSRLLTKAQQKAFYEAFQFFDHKKNGKISGEELLETLQRVGIPADKKSVFDFISYHENDEEGGMAYEEYLNFMTSETTFTAMLKGRVEDPSVAMDKNLLLYQVLSKLIQDSVLDLRQRNEIVAFYTNKLKKMSIKPTLGAAEHVVKHYADGACTSGLTEKEAISQLQVLRQLILREHDEKKKSSPYAHPLRLVPTRSRDHKLWVPKKPNQPGWQTRPITCYQGVRLPEISANKPNTYQFVKEIRKKVVESKENYLGSLTNARRKNFDEVWESLHISKIAAPKLQLSMEQAFNAYTINHIAGRNIQKKSFVSNSAKKSKSPSVAAVDT